MSIDEVAKAADVFPVKFAHIKEFHILLAGTDPFVDLQVSDAHMRLRVEQELRNLSIRLRKRYTFISEDKVVVSQALKEVAEPLSISLRSLLKLTGKPVPKEKTTEAIMNASGEAFELDKDALARIAKMRHEEANDPDVLELFEEVMKSVDKAAKIANDLE